MTQDSDNLVAMNDAWHDFWALEDRLKVLRASRDCLAFSLHASPDFVMEMNAAAAKDAIDAEIDRVKVKRRKALQDIKGVAADVLDRLEQM